MSIRHVHRAAAKTLTATALAVAALATLSSVAGAAVTQGSIVPGSAVPVGTFTAGTPFSSGQGINIVIPANSVFTGAAATANVNILECSAPNGVAPTSPTACDGNTQQGDSFAPNSDGSINYQAENAGDLYPVYALPDNILLGEGTSGPACGTTAATECILFIGDNQADFTSPHVWSQPFFVQKNSNDLGGNPGDGSAPPAGTPSTSVAAVPTSSVFGQSVGLTATVTTNSPATCTPSGPVNFTDGSTSLGSGTISSGKATLSTSALPVGSDTVTATFPATTSCPTSLGTTTVAVAQASTTTAVSAAPAGGSTTGQSVTFTAAVAPVAPGAGSPSGTVTFKDGTTTLGSPTVSSGSASVTTSTLSTGSHTITATYSGDANFAGSNGSINYSVGLAGTTTTVAAIPASPSVFGQSVSFTATVTTSGSGSPTGNVTFKDGTTTLGSGTISAGTASFATPSLVVGSHSISAVYSGDTNFNGSTGSLTYVVGQSSTTTVLTVAPSSPTVWGQSVTFTGTVAPVAPGAGSPSGTVNFVSGSVTLGSGTITAGKATFTTAALPVGSDPVVAQYVGDANFASSSSAITTFVVNQASVTGTLTSSANPSTGGSSVTFTDTLAVVAPGAGSPTGTVTFKDGATTLGTGTVTSGKATFATSALANGSHPITAVYGGDTDFAGSTSNTVTQVVTQISTTTGLASSANPAAPGAAVTFTATVTASSGTPTGTVTFNDGSTAIGTGTLNGSGVATLTTSTLALGTHPITAVYGGTAAFSGSTSAVLNEVIALGATSTTLTSSVNPATPGTAVTFTATVSSPSGTPTGTVTFNDGSTAIGTGTLNGSGQATLTTSTLALGSHPITAVYGGSTGLSGSTSAVLTEVIALVSTATTVTSSANPAVPGAAVTFTAKVTASSGTPTGTVTFNDGSTAIGTGTLNGSGQATLTTSTLALGTHPITAVYGGSTGDSGSTSAVLNQVIALVSTTTGLTSSVNPATPGTAVTFTATVTASSGTPTGTVTFNDGSTAIGTGTLSGGVATLTTSTLTLGTHPITAVYGGTTAFSGSTSAVLNEIIALITSTTTVTSSLNPSGPGAAVTFTATVTASSGTPTGTVTFKDGATVLGTGTLNAAGQTTLTTSTLALGNHPITVVYAGTATIAGSTSAVLTQVVALISTTTTVISSANPSGPGQGVTFVATVTSGSGTPNGPVTFMDGTTVLGSVMLNGLGQAAFSTTTLAIGSHPITVVYAGAGPFQGSTSAVLTQVVGRFATVLVGLPQITINPLAINLPAVQATLKTTAGTPVAGQTIVFLAGATVLCTGVTNAAGVASCVPPGLDELLIILNRGVDEQFMGTPVYSPSTSQTFLIG